MKNPRVSVKLSGKIENWKFNSILIIDDDEFDLFIARNILIRNNSADIIFTETSGRAALHFLLNTKEVPDLILLDYLMFEMNGLEFIEEFKRLPTHITEKCKIVLLSAMVKFYEIDRITMMNSEHTLGVLGKPLVVSQLTEMINKRC